MNNQLLYSLPNEYSVHIADMNDFNAICEFYKSVITSLDERINYPVWTWGVHPSEEMIQTAIENKQLYLLKSNNQIAGAALINEELEGEELVSWQGKNPCGLHLFGINPDLGGKGLSDAFLKYLLDLARNSYDSMRLNLIEGNFPARNLYARHGFKTTGHIDMDLDDEGILYFEMMELMF